MSTDSFSSFLDKEQNSRIKLLGGEPTQHPNFREIIKLIVEKQRNLQLISNFLFSEDILLTIEEAMKVISVYFLANASELDKGFNRFDLWKKNYISIFNKLKKKDKMSIGFTLEDNKEENYYLLYLDGLYREIPIDRLRLSLSFPSREEDKDPLKIVKNRKLGKILVDLLLYCLQRDIIPSLDCVVYPCLFANEAEYEFVKRTLNFNSSICRSLPLDLFHDGQVSYCFPLKNVITANYVDYASSGEVDRSLREKYIEKSKQQTVPVECSACSFSIKGDCEGPSLCFYSQ